MKKIIGIFLTVVLSMSLILTGCGKVQETKDAGQKSDSGKTTAIENIVIEVESYGSPADSTRSTNLQEAAQELNKILEEKGDNRRVEVKTNHVSSGYDEYNRKFMLAHKSGGGADIRAISHSDIAMMAQGGYILQLDDYVNNSEWSKYVQDIYPNLWDASKWMARIYGIPQDTEARPLYFRKDILKKLGWSDEQISALPEKIKNGEFTLEDMTRLAREAVKKGAAKIGIYHRPNNGADFITLVYDFGGRLFDENTGKLIFERKPIKDTLNYFYQIAQVDKVIPSGMTSMEWRQIHKGWVEGEVLFWYGGTWHWGEYQKVEYHSKLGKLSENYMFQNMGYALVPAPSKGGKPVTLSQPYMYVINRNTKYPDLAFALIAVASQPKYNVKHAVESGHLVISSAAAEDTAYKQNRFLHDVQYMLNYTTVQPNHPEFGKFTSAFFKAIQAVEMGEYDPEQAVNWLEEQLKNDVKDMVFVD
ncbi:extracellular solute-binding protein [Biomaibacter acetigenes]|uniref:Extracellular solute-binding protein n=1 Tax=Biomaibacter acetigenes TaxID=2316383 RepID=A0A3G2R429_9FIRM|nr:extracellular solute-binding protein [Biomaibacter acetigenes]AYO30085.1 extracellular solute-binding protein [Biomaibacter acetigenes]